MALIIDGYDQGIPHGEWVCVSYTLGLGRPFTTWKSKGFGRLTLLGVLWFVNNSLAMYRTCYMAVIPSSSTHVYPRIWGFLKEASGTKLRYTMLWPG